MRRHRRAGRTRQCAGFAAPCGTRARNPSRRTRSPCRRRRLSVVRRAALGVSSRTCQSPRGVSFAVSPLSVFLRADAFFVAAFFLAFFFAAFFVTFVFAARLREIGRASCRVRSKDNVRGVTELKQT